MTRRLSHMLGTVTASPQLSTCHGVSEATVALLQTFANVTVTTGPSISKGQKSEQARYCTTLGTPISMWLPSAMRARSRIRDRSVSNIIYKYRSCKYRRFMGKVHSRACILSPMSRQKKCKCCILASKTMSPWPQGTISWQRVRAG
jgi:hypothetical protein